jgi:hypothetical protein
MIIGRGSIASIINDREEIIYFASGNSNRFELTEESKNKEIGDVLSFKDTDKMFVYFSGLNIYYSTEKPYTKFKIYMEEIIRNNFKHYCILRIGSINWGDNPNTLYNYLKNRIINNEPLEIQDTFRYLNSKEEIVEALKKIPTTGKYEIDLTGKKIKVIDLIDQIRRDINKN